MNIEQFAMLVFRANNSDPKCGTGYFVTENRLLTSAHGVSGNNAVSVRIDGEEIPLKPVWRPKSYKKMDLAVLEMTDNRKGRFDHFIKPAFHRRAVQKRATAMTYGYPKAVQTGKDTTDRERKSLKGELESTDPENRLLHFIAEDGPLDSKLWGGFSGAPLFIDGNIVGVVAERFPELNRWLKIQPVAPLFEDAEYEGLREVLAIPSRDEEKFKAVEEMAAELKAHPHLHWAFSLAWADQNDYDGLSDGNSAPENELAEALIVKLSNYKAAGMVDLADRWLINFEKTRAEKEKSRAKKGAIALNALIEKEPSSDSHRFETADKLVDVVFRLLAVRVSMAETPVDAVQENPEITLNTPDDNVVELVSSAWDDRPPSYNDLIKEYAPLVSRFQVPQPPPGSLHPTRDLRVDMVGIDLLNEIYQRETGEEDEKRNITDDEWKNLNVLLQHIMLRDEREKRGRYFVVVGRQEKTKEFSGVIASLKKKLKWLRFFVLADNPLFFDDQFLPLRDTIYRHQQYQKKPG